MTHRAVASKNSIDVFSDNSDAILVHGARTHNLKNISVSIPLNKLTVITGVSGSGKSSLAFDTIYAEGQRRYVESLSAYARQFLERMDKPDVDEIIGICPAIAVRQKTSSRNPRSTIATQTEIYDYLRLLFARIGKPFCCSCGKEVKRESPQSAAETILRLAEGTKFYVLFPAGIGFDVMPESQLNDSEEESLKKTSKKKSVSKQNTKSEEVLLKQRVKAHVMSLMQRGFTRIFSDSKILELTSVDSFTKKNFDDVYVLVDRLTVNSDNRERLVDSLETAYREGNGQVEIYLLETFEFIRFSEAFECHSCRISFPLLEPRLFSFNSPYGACQTCQGFGNTIGLNMDLVIPNKQLSLEQGAIELFTKSQFDWAYADLCKACHELEIPTNIPFQKLSQDHQKVVTDGTGSWIGINGFFELLEAQKYKMNMRILLSKYRSYTHCPDCNGARLRQEALSVKIAEKNIAEVLAMSIKNACDWFSSLILSSEETTIADRLLLEIRHRLKFLKEVGLDYLTLNRLTSTLSGGESQRIQLATHLGSSLVGALYVLDEPSIGLHPRDNRRLLSVLQGLRDIGNTVLVVEHDEEVISAADRVIDIGPGAGELGGEVIFSGAVSDLLKQESSLTGKYLKQKKHILEQKIYAPKNQKISIRNASKHNLNDLSVDIPLGVMVCVTGVSGSGKSTLVHEILYRGLQNGGLSADCGFELEGGRLLDEVVCVDQSPIGRTPRSNPATYLKIYDVIREEFALTREARSAGFSAGNFSFNVPGGRCETCQGDGTVTIEMQFLADVELICEDCNGTRFKSDLLKVKYRGKNISEVLNLTVHEAIGFFGGVKRITNKLEVLNSIGLGYLRLGQPSNTLSGGEAQRIKLAAYISRTDKVRTLYIFDEPTTGLHFDDIRKLLLAFKKLLEAGSSLVVIEHNLDVIRAADWIIDLGPEGGDQGGQVIGCGTPSDIAKIPLSYTGQFLREIS